MFNLGFPADALDKNLGKAAANEKIIHSDKLIELKGFTDTSDFIEWKNNIPVEKVEQKQPCAGNDAVIDKIRKYPIMNKTPFETQAFVLTLQNELNGYV